MTRRFAAVVIGLILLAGGFPLGAWAGETPQFETEFELQGEAQPKAEEPKQVEPQPPAVTPEEKPKGTPEKVPVPPVDEGPAKPDGEPLKLPGAEPEKVPSPATPPPLPEPENQQQASADDQKFPTPAELIKRIQQKKASQAKQSKVVHFDLATAVIEKPADFSLFGDTTYMTLRSLVERIHLARNDKDVRGVLLTLGEPSLNFAQAQELRDALAELRRAGKKTFVYADSYDTVTYTLASGATNVCLMEGGEIMIPGVGMEAMFARGLLDKIGVRADYVQIGEYKGADEQYTRTGASEQMKGEMNKLVEALYDQIVDGISLNRNLPRETVGQMIDETIMTAAVAKERGFVDHLVDMDGLRALMAQELGNDSGVDIVSNFGQPQRAHGEVTSPLQLFQMFSKKPETTGKPAVALIYAEGTIVDGEGGEGLLGGSGVGSSTIRRALRRAAMDDNVKAIVIRIDSPGGSAQASEVMWQAARSAAKKKPVVISIGSMAASGGYYLASAGDQIYADPSAIVGSIGVVGGKFVMKDLYGKIGVNTEAFTKGRNADLFSSSKPFDERQRRMVTNWMKGTYEQFTRRVMTTRTGKIKDIDQVARGRIFLAKQAKDLGMVDEIGGVQNAIADAAGRAKMKAGDFEVQVLPQPRTLADLLMAVGGTQAASPVDAKLNLGGGAGGELSIVLKSLDPGTRKALVQQLQMFQLLQKKPVVLVTPYAVTVR